MPATRAPRRSRGIAPIGAVSATGERRKGRPAWIFPLLFLLALFILAFGAIGLVRDDTADRGGDQPPVLGSDASSSLPTAAATLSVGGREVRTGSNLGDLVGETATISGATVQQVDGDSGFFVGGGNGTRTFVEWGPRAGTDEARRMPKVGDRVDLTGPIAEAPKQPGRTFGIPVASERVILKQGGYINADRVTAR